MVAKKHESENGFGKIIGRQCEVKSLSSRMTRRGNPEDGRR